MSAFDLKPYQEGDALRHLDLKRFLRSRELLVRRFEEERAGHLVIILDASASMGAPPETWAVAIRTLQLVTEATLRGGSGVTWLIERAGQCTRTRCMQSLQDVSAQLGSLRQLGPHGARAERAELAYQVRRSAGGSSCLYLTDLLGADVSVPLDMSAAQQLARGRFPLPAACRWSLCLRLEAPELWAEVGVVSDPERGGSYLMPSSDRELSNAQAKLKAHLQSWEALLKACHGPLLRRLTWSVGAHTA